MRVRAEAGRPDEDGGWLFAYLPRESGAEVVALDARAIDEGPVATHRSHRRMEYVINVAVRPS